MDTVTAELMSDELNDMLFDSSWEEICLEGSSCTIKRETPTVFSVLTRFGAFRVTVEATAEYADYIAAAIEADQTD